MSAITPDKDGASAAKIARGFLSGQSAMFFIVSLSKKGLYLGKHIKAP